LKSWIIIFFEMRSCYVAKSGFTSRAQLVIHLQCLLSHWQQRNVSTHPPITVEFTGVLMKYNKNIWKSFIPLHHREIENHHVADLLYIKSKNPKMCERPCNMMYSFLPSVSLFWKILIITTIFIHENCRLDLYHKKKGEHIQEIQE
jgi:hypothetical protein